MDTRVDTSLGLPRSACFARQFDIARAVSSRYESFAQIWTSQIDADTCVIAELEAPGKTPAMCANAQLIELRSAMRGVRYAQRRDTQNALYR